MAVIQRMTLVASPFTPTYWRSSDPDPTMADHPDTPNVTLYEKFTVLGGGTSFPATVADDFTVSDDLTVDGDATIKGDLDVQGTYTQIDVDVSTTEQWNITNDGTGPAVTVNQLGTQPIADFQDDGTSALFIKDGGNVGIGTTTPAKTLEVKAGSSGNGINLISHDNATAVVQLESGSAGGYLQLHNSSNAQKVRLDSTGNSWLDGGSVGIGTDNPDEKLHIDGSAAKLKITDPSYDGEVVLLTSSGNPHIELKSHGADAAGDISFRDNADNQEWAIATNTVATKGLEFIDGSSSVVMNLEHGGNVGIGTTSPIAKLDVSGKIAISSESTTPAQPDNGKGYIYSKADGKVYWRSFDLTETDLTASSSGATLAFKTLALATPGGPTWGSNDVTADSATDTLTLTAGTDITLETSPSDDAVRISYSGTAGGTGGWTDGTNVVYNTTAADKVGIGHATPKTALSVLHDYDTVDFNTQLASTGEGGGDILKYGKPSSLMQVGKLYAMQPTNDGTWLLADANEVLKGQDQLIGVAMGTAADSDGVLLRGFVRVPTSYLSNYVSGSAPGTPIYVSASAGLYDFNPPSGSGDYARVLGYCVSTDTNEILIYFNPSKSWVDIKNASPMSIPSAGVISNRTSVPSGAYSVVDTDYILGCNVSSAVITINLQSAAIAGEGRTLVIKDEFRNSHNYNITVDPYLTQTIDGGITKVIKSSGASITIYCDGSNWHII